MEIFGLFWRLLPFWRPFIPLYNHTHDFQLAEVVERDRLKESIEIDQLFGALYFGDVNLD